MDIIFITNLLTAALIAVLLLHTIVEENRR